MNGKMTYAILVGLTAVASPQVAHADFWSKHVAIHPKSFGELLPPCWGHPQDCRPENMPGDTKNGNSSPSQQPVSPNYAAACICLQEDGTKIVWFTSKPLSYGQVNVDVTVHTYEGCDSFVRCEYRYYTSFNGTINASSWAWRQNTINGNTIYLMSGR
jgi:hypothetical protein